MSKFYEEVNQQPQAIRDTIRGNEQFTLKQKKPLLLTGMGSSLAASELLATFLHLHGYQATAIDNSELLYYYPQNFLDEHQVIVVSQSGESFEAKELAARYSQIAAVTNSKGSALSKLASDVYYTYAGKEEAIASSKSFTTTAALLLLLGAKLVGKDLTQELYQTADMLEEMLLHAEAYRAQIGLFIDPDKPLILLGRGPSIYTARQGSLTLKETARMFTEAMSAPQFRHGPFELIRENLQAIFFNPKGSTYTINQKYVLEMANLGAKILYVSDEALEHDNVSSIVIPSVHEYLSIIPYSLVVQLAAIELSHKRGLVAGEAKIISKVTGKE